MGVDLRNGKCADDLASDTEGVGEQAVARIMDVVRATELPADRAEHPVSELTAGPSEHSEKASDVTDSQHTRQVDREIAFHQLHAAAGDAAAARRVAELYELVNSHEDAAVWWCRAAELGDADARAYVRHILTSDGQVVRAC